jgi:hypothetical protein
MLLLGTVALALYARGPRPGIGPAAACSCANQRPPTLQQAPGSPPLHPRNPRLRLTPIWSLARFPKYADWARRNGFDGTKWNLELRPKDAAPGTKPIGIEQRLVGEAEQAILEVWPKAPLDARAQYVLAPSGGGNEHVGGFPSMGVEITTGDLIDTVPPSWAGAKAGRYLPKGLQEGSSCSVSAPLIDIEVTEPHDDQTPSDQIVVAVWRGTEDAALPAVIAAVRRGHVHLGRPDLCSEADFSVRAGQAEKLRLRALDLAGNASAPSDITIDASLPAAASGSGCARSCGRL